MSINQVGEKNHMWKGDNVGYEGVHSWIKIRKTKPQVCERCKKGKVIDLANISGKYKRDVNDFEWLCRKCHMNEDGRINNLKRGGKKRGIQIKKICLNCKKEFVVVPSNDYRKNCSRKCIDTLRSKNKVFYGNQFVKNRRREK